MWHAAVLCVRGQKSNFQKSPHSSKWMYKSSGIFSMFSWTILRLLKKFIGAGVESHRRAHLDSDFRDVFESKFSRLPLIATSNSFLHENLEVVSFNRRQTHSDRGRGSLFVCVRERGREKSGSIMTAIINHKGCTIWKLRTWSWMSSVIKRFLKPCLRGIPCDHSCTWYLYLRVFNLFEHQLCLHDFRNKILSRHFTKTQVSIDLKQRYTKSHISTSPPP